MGAAFSARVESSRVTRCVRAARVCRRLVEPDVSVDAKPEQQKIETTDRCDRFFVTLAFTVRIGRHSIEAVGLVGTEVDSREQVLRQESPEAAGVRRVETDEFIQQERRRVREVGLPC